MYVGLQVGRGIATLAVLLHHASLGTENFYGGIFFSGLWEFGAIGVDFFFVLSGFIIYWVHSADDQNMQSALTYYKKRIIRIYPPFILISAIMLIAYSVYPSLSYADRDIGIITSIFLVPTPPLNPALNVSWTLMHEMLFYSIFFILYINKKILYGFLVIWSISIILIDFTSLNGIIRNFFLNPHNLEFLFGVISAIIIKNNKGNVFQLLIGLSMLFIYIAYLSYQTNSHIIFTLLIVKIYLGITFMFIVTGLCSIDSKVKYPNVLIYIGAASYSIYLIHNPAISILNRIAQKISLYGYWENPYAFFIFVTIFSLLIGLMYYIVWEKPMLKLLKEKFLTKKSNKALCKVEQSN